MDRVSEEATKEELYKALRHKPGDRDLEELVAEVVKEDLIWRSRWDSHDPWRNVRYDEQRGIFVTGYRSRWPETLPRKLKEYNEKRAEESRAQEEQSKSQEDAGKDLESEAPVKQPRLWVLVAPAPAPAKSEHYPFTVTISYDE